MVWREREGEREREREREREGWLVEREITREREREREGVLKRETSGDIVVKTVPVTAGRSARVHAVPRERRLGEMVCRWRSGADARPSSSAMYRTWRRGGVTLLKNNSPTT